MTQAVLCPSCQKRFDLPERPPKTFTCTACNTPMDLTAFGGSDAPVQPTAPSRPTSPRARPGGARRRRAAGPSRRAPPPQQQGLPRQKNNNAVWAIIGVGVLALFVVYVATKGPEEDGEPPKPTAKVEPPPPVEEIPDVAPPRQPYRRDARKRTRKGKPRISNVRLQIFDWPDELDAGTRAQVEDSIMQMYRGGRDGVEAGDWLVGQGHIVCGRLISEFKAIHESPGFDNREGASMASVIDGTLRRIDGFIEREWKETARIRAWGIYAAPSFIERTAKRWTWWWKHQEWKTNPRTPWDPHEDIEGTTDGYKRPGAKKKSKKKGGYDKPAGSG